MPWEKTFTFHCTLQTGMMIILNVFRFFWTTEIVQISQRTVFCSTLHPFVHDFSPLFKPHPWPFSSLLFFCCSSLVPLFSSEYQLGLQIRLCPYPVSFFPSVSSRCALGHRWLRSVLVILCCVILCFLCLVSIEYQLLSLVMEACLIHVYIFIKAGKHTHTDIRHRQKHTHTCM